MKDRDTIYLQALEIVGAGNERLAELLTEILLADNVILPEDGDISGWNIKRLSDMEIRVESMGRVWRQSPPGEVQIGERTFKPNQLALAWGTRMVPGAAFPTPVAYLVSGYQSADGKVSAAVLARFSVAERNGQARWFYSRPTNRSTRVPIPQSLERFILAFLTSRMPVGAVEEGAAVAGVGQPVAL